MYWKSFSWEGGGALKLDTGGAKLKNYSSPPNKKLPSTTTAVSQFLI